MKQQISLLGFTHAIKKLLCLGFASCLLWATPLALASENFSNTSLDMAERLRPTSVKQTEAAMKAVKEKIEAANDAAKKARENYSLQEKKLAKLNHQLSTNQKSAFHTHREITQLDAELADLTRKKIIETKKIHSQETWLKRDLVQSYQNGQGSHLALMLNQKDPATASRLLQYTGYINKARENKILQLEYQKQRLAELIDTTHLKQDQLADKLSELRRSEAQYLKLKKKQTKLLAHIQAKIKTQDQTIERLEIDKAQLDQVMAELITLESVPLSLEQAPFKGLKGKLEPPTNGEIVRKFGEKQAAGLKIQGVWFNAPAGNLVYAVHHGQVIFAEWLRGYGQLIILDHGDNYYSLYGHNEALLKKPGDWVMSGDPVATSGSATLNENSISDDGQSGLYFEIRKNGQAINPSTWLAKDETR